MSPVDVQELESNRNLDRKRGKILTNLVSQAFNAPVLCSGVNGFNNISIQLISLCECPIEGHLTDFSSHGSLCQLGNGVLRIFDAVRGLVKRRN